MNLFSTIKGIFRGQVRSAEFGVRNAAGGPLSNTPQSALPTPHSLPPTLARILRPAAATRWLMPYISAITPQYIEYVLRNALAGSHVQQWELFDLMFDTWPELAACAQELTCGVTGKKLIFEPFAEEGEKPAPSAIERMKLVSSALRSMKPRAAADENGLTATIADLADGWFRGVTALEVDWQQADTASGRIIAPRCTYWAHPTAYGFGADGELGLRITGGSQYGALQPSSLSLQPLSPGTAGAIVPFPEHKILVGIHKAKAGNALGGALLRPLAWWWCAANFSADWLLNLSQVFGLPFRWANYDPNAPQATIDAICTMLQNMGSAGWAAFPAGTTLEMKEAGKGSDHSPQGELLDRADRYARLLILGQTLSGSQSSSKGGGKAFGSVEAHVKDERINAAGAYVAAVLNEQLIPSILALNYGDTDDAPQIRLTDQDEAGLAEAQRDQVLIASGLKIGAAFLRQKYDIPEPQDGEETVGGEVAGASRPSPKDLGRDGPATSSEDDATDPAEAAVARIAAIQDDELFCKALETLAKAS